jgi:uncharacterized protein
MRVAITGSSGLIGTALRRALEGAGHSSVPVVRSAPSPGEIGWDPAAGTIDAAGFEGVDAVVHLAGAGIGDRRWTAERKRVILESRTQGTSLLAGTLAGLDSGPSVLLSASGIDYYGDRGDDVLTETSPPGSGFMSEVCSAWESAAHDAVDAGIRTVFLRTSPVQTPEGGSLQRMLLPFKLGLGGRIGSGRQWWSWISVDDHVRAVLHLLHHDVSGPVNVTAPEPVRNAHFTKALGRQLRRPTVIPTPAFAPKLLFGRELVETLLYESKRAVPAVLRSAGFEFRHPTIEDCFAALLGDQEIAGS